MIYSSWRPDRGGYEYWETSERFGLGDDLPVPSLRQISPLGVASTDAGRRLPRAARLVGSGDLARGSISPTDRRGLSGGDDAPTMLPKVLGVAALGLLVFVVYQASEDAVSLKRMFK